mmetsp:Transcript_12010/g.38464  ORF Transcript_12010/g.38464 Transcript_12010/m.38464 type:complete len:334 (-) Transcript_12010:1149-2150(-)
MSGWLAAGGRGHEVCVCGAAHKRHREAELALLAARQVVRPYRVPAWLEADTLEHRLEAAVGELRRREPLDCAGELQVLECAEGGEGEVVLRADAREAADGVHASAAHRMAVHCRLSGRLREEAREDADRGRLAGAVLPEQRGDLPLVQREGESVEGDHRLWLGGESAREADEAHGLACALGRRAALLHRGAFRLRGPFGHLLDPGWPRREEAGRPPEPAHCGGELEGPGHEQGGTLAGGGELSPGESLARRLELVEAVPARRAREHREDAERVPGGGGDARPLEEDEESDEDPRAEEGECLSCLLGALADYARHEGERGGHVEDGGEEEEEQV